MPGANNGGQKQRIALSPGSQKQPPSSGMPLTQENLTKLNAQSRYPPAEEDVYRTCLAQGRDTLERLQNWAYEQRWENINLNDENIEDALECFGLLSVDHIQTNLFAIPNSEATPLGRFVADIPNGINRRVYDLSDRSFTEPPLVSTKGLC